MNTFGQITEGSIRFERRLNLFKKYTDPNTQKWLGEKNKYSYDYYYLYFNDTSSVFIPDPDQEPKQGMLQWVVQQNSEIQNFSSKKNVTLFNFFGQIIVVKDSLRPRSWKYTGKHRNIANYDCTQALLHINDSTRIYAWFTTEIVPQIGPENFWGLPGAILGVASEDGGTTYFATEVKQKVIDISKIIPKYNDKKAITFAELKDKMENEYGSRKEAKSIIEDVLTWQFF